MKNICRKIITTMLVIGLWIAGTLISTTSPVQGQETSSDPALRTEGIPNGLQCNTTTTTSAPAGRCNGSVDQGCSGHCGYAQSTDSTCGQGVPYVTNCNNVANIVTVHYFTGDCTPKNNGDCGCPPPQNYVEDLSKSQTYLETDSCDP